MVRLEGLGSFEEEMVGGLNLDRVRGLGRERKRARLQEQRERGRTEGIVAWQTEAAPAALRDVWERRPGRGRAAAGRPASVRGSGY